MNKILVVCSGTNRILHDKIVHKKSICPLCKCPLNQYESWAWKNKQSLPVFHVWAVSLLTKDMNGDWLGVPYNVTFEE